MLERLICIFKRSRENSAGISKEVSNFIHEIEMLTGVICRAQQTIEAREMVIRELLKGRQPADRVAS